MSVCAQGVVVACNANERLMPYLRLALAATLRSKMSFKIGHMFPVLDIKFVIYT